MLEGSRLVDATPHHVSWDEVIDILKDYEFLVLFTSTMGWGGDQKMAEVIKQTYPNIKIAFVGPPVTTSTDKALNECPAIDFVCRREFDFSVVEFANGKPLERDPRRQLQGRQRRHPAQPRPPADHPREARRDALGHRHLQARPRRHQVQRPVPAASVRRALLDPRLPGAVHLLPLAADALRPRMAQALHRRRGRRNGPRQAALPRCEGVLLRRRHLQHPEGRAPSSSARS